MELPKHCCYTSSTDGFRATSTQRTSLCMIMRLTIGPAWAKKEQILKLNSIQKINIFIILNLHDRSMIHFGKVDGNPVVNKEKHHKLHVIYIGWCYEHLLLNWSKKNICLLFPSSQIECQFLYKCFFHIKVQQHHMVAIINWKVIFNIFVFVASELWIELKA